jgi:thiopurine S-methyltransferase
MHHDFWHQRWQNQQIGFHQGEINPFLLAHFQALGLQVGTRVFVPLCGKSLICTGCWHKAFKWLALN